MSQLFCSVQQLVWPQPGTELTSHCASADFSSRSPGYQLREEATVEVWPARLAAKSDHDWSGQLLDWRRPWHCRAKSHWTLNPLQRKFFSVNVKLWSLKWKNTFFHPLLNFLVSVVISVSVPISYYFNIKLRWDRCNLQENSKYPC